MDGLEQASASLNQAIESTGNAPDMEAGQGTAAPASDRAPSSSDSEMLTAQEMIDLDAAQKFKFQGKEWTPEELHKAILRQQDYTKKTQEISNEKKFMTNLSHDLREVKRNPSLAEEFKSIYPKNYHQYLDVILEQAEAEAMGIEESASSDKLPADLQKRLDLLEKRTLEAEKRFSSADQKVHEAAVAKEEQKIDQLFGTLSSKYEFGVEEAVLAKAEALISQGYKMTDQAWDRLWKANHDANLKKVESWHDKKVKAQLQKNNEGGDIGRGGGVPAQGRKRMSFDDATAAAIASLSKK